MPRLKSKYAIDSTGLSEKLKSLRLDKDENNDLPALPIVPFDVYNNPSYAIMPTTIVSRSVPAFSANIAAVNATATSAAYGLNVNAGQFVWNPTASTTEILRTPNVYKNVLATANGSTAIWTSAATKKWRLMGCCLTIVQGSTTAAITPMNIRLLDVAADTGIGITLAAPGVTLPTPPAPVQVLSIPNMLNGILAAAANTALNVNLSTAFVTGGVSVQVWGCEE